MEVRYLYNIEDDVVVDTTTGIGYFQDGRTFTHESNPNLYAKTVFLVPGVISEQQFKNFLSHGSIQDV